jgi:hypothetical protein
LEGRGEEEVGKVASSALPSRWSQCTSLPRVVTTIFNSYNFLRLVVSVLLWCAKVPPLEGTPGAALRCRLRYLLHLCRGSLCSESGAVAAP